MKNLPDFGCGKKTIDCFNVEKEFLKIPITNPAFLAPMAGLTDQPFRRICKRLGAGFLFGEFVSADGLVYESRKTFDLLDFLEEEHPFAVQIFGSDPGIMARAAKIVHRFNPNVLDINYGCPVKKVVKRGAGAALLRNLDRLETIAKAVVDVSEIPVTAKIRIGWSKDEIVAVEAAQRLERAGIQAITVHARTQTMGYSGRAVWSVIADVKRAVSIPVLGNGDIWKASDAIKMLQETGCDFVMVGRGAIGNPWIFREIGALLNNERENLPPTLREKGEICLQHFGWALEFYGLQKGVFEMRKHLAAYTKGLPGASRFRTRLMRLTQPETIVREIEIFFGI